jgi:hypothetical protein
MNTRALTKKLVDALFLSDVNNLFDVGRALDHYHRRVLQARNARRLTPAAAGVVLSDMKYLLRSSLA